MARVKKVVKAGMSILERMGRPGTDTQTVYAANTELSELYKTQESITKP